MSIAKVQIEKILNEYTKAKESMIKLTSDLSRNDLATQDLLHFIELQSVNQALAFSTVKKIQELRNERRIIKNELEPLQKLVDTIDKDKLQKTYEGIIKVEEIQKTRKYTPRIYHNGLEDLPKVANL